MKLGITGSRTEKAGFSAKSALSKNEKKQKNGFSNCKHRLLLVYYEYNIEIQELNGRNDNEHRF